MSRVCQLTGAGPRSGHNVSHSNRKTKRRFLPNLLSKWLVDPKTGLKVKVRMTARALRTLSKSPDRFGNEIHSLAKRRQKNLLKQAGK